MFPKGTIIAFEGLDCSFKETNYKTFCERFREEFPEYEDKIISESFPRYNNTSSLFVKKWLRGEFDRDRCQQRPAAINSFYSLDRFSFWYEYDLNGNTMDMKRNDCCFIFDRYSYSNSLYNPGKGLLSRISDNPTIKDFTTERINFGVPAPHIMVWMRMRDFDVLKDLLYKKNFKDKNESDIEFIKKVWDRSEYVLEHKFFKEQEIGTDLIVCECLNEDGSIKSEKEIADFIWEEIHKALKRREEKLEKLATLANKNSD